MEETTKKILKRAMNYCDNELKSTEFTIQYMMDSANVSKDCVIDFLYESIERG